MTTRSGRQVRPPVPPEAYTVEEARQLRAQLMAVGSSRFDEVDEDFTVDTSEGFEHGLDLLMSISGTQMTSEDEELEGETGTGRC